MATPAFTSFDTPTHRIVGTRVEVNPGNWSQFPGGDALLEPRYIFRYWIDGAPLRADYGAILTRDDPDVHYAGEGQNVLDLGFLPPGVHSIVVQIWAGNLQKAGGDITQDWYEYGGNKFHSTDTYVFSFSVSISPSDPPEPDLVLLEKQARDATRKLVLKLREQGMSWNEVKQHRYGHAYYNDLKGK